jgi:hypothetical protein
MKKNVEKLFIGKDIARTATVTYYGTATYGLAEGEILVLDANKEVLTPGYTVNDSAVIYIAEGLGDTVNYVTETGSSITGVRRVKISDAIHANALVTYSGKTYKAPTEATFTISGTFSPVAGDTYELRIVYKDLYERPGQTTKTYSVVSTDTHEYTVYKLLTAAINADPRARVTATHTTDTTTSMSITAKVVTDNPNVTSIDEYKQVNCALFLVSDNWDDAAVTQTVYPTPGSGNWRQVRDDEKWSQGYEGQTNRTAFPVIGPEFRTDKTKSYNIIVIRHKNWFTTAGGREEQVDITTKIALPINASQTGDVLSCLNPWIESAAKGLSPIVF